MAGINNYDLEGSLVIGGVSMHRPAWAVLGDDTGAGGLLQLLSDVQQRGSDRVLPGAAGAIAYPRRIAPSTYELRILIAGDVDESGNLTANGKEGLVANLKYLMTNVVEPVASATGTRAAVLTLPGQTATNADIHVFGLYQRGYYYPDGDSTKALWEGSLQIDIPAGRFA